LLRKLRQTDTKEVSDKGISDLENEIVARLSALPRQETEAIRSVRREFSRRLANERAEMVVELALKLIRRPETVPRFLTYELVQHHKQACRSLRAGSLQKLGHGIDNWGAVDAFACYLAGPSWRERQVSDALIRRWARSSDRWQRRIALVSTVALNSKARGGRGDTERTLMICGMLLEDRDDMVVKAISWALRELSKRDPKSVRNFLRENEGILAARVTREVNNKLQTGLKNPRKQFSAADS
jgi:3-methyladenine DNA glycosylase AlkD